MAETTPTPLLALSNTYLDELVEQGGDELHLQMLLIEVSSYACDDQVGRNGLKLLRCAYHFAKDHHEGQIRKSGEPFLAHCVEVARLLAQLGLDHTTVAAGLLHDVIEDTPATYEEVAELFGDKIAELIAGVTKIDQITCESREERQAETYRKLLISVFKDGRVMLIKLADRLHNMRTLQHLSPESRERTASETLEVYAPLAHRFGIARFRWQLEDQSLKFLEPEIYRELRDKVAMTRKGREAYIKKFQDPLEECLHVNGIKAEFMSRAKNFYSIYNKMKLRGKPFEEIYDLLAVRIITSTEDECYQILGKVHELYTHIPKRLKDYISTPKSNMYQSLHTSVIGPKGQYVEVQIRTAQMHQTAEIGIAAHWRDKFNDKESGIFNPSWLKRFGDWEQAAPNPLEFMENLKAELASPDEIFVFTPKGDLHHLPKGATPIDFAFAVHTDIGLHCLRAKVNDQGVPLDATLGTGETVEIVTAPQQKPKLTWLDQVKTAKALQAIHHSLRANRRIKGRPNQTTRYCQHCNPLQSHAIVGLPIDHTDHLLIHRINCYKLERISADRLDNEVEWEEEPAFTVQLCTRSWDRTHLLADIARAISDAGPNIHASATRTEGNVAEQDFWFDIADNEQLCQVMDQIKRIKGVLEVLCVDEPANGDPLP